MSRRRFVTLVSAGVLLVVGMLAALFVVSVTQTSYGREQVRKLIASTIAPRVKGRLYIGKMSGGFITGVTIDSLEIRDEEDSLFLASGPVTLDWDPRDLADRRVLLSEVTVQRPVVYVRQHENGEWNFRRIFGRGEKRPRGTERGFGDYIVANDVTLKDGRFWLTMPWHPDDSLRGARRDSAIAHNLQRTDRVVRRTKEGLARTWRWSGLQATAPYVRIADPDSVGKLFAIQKMNVDEVDPPFIFRNIAGVVRNLGDSIWLDVRHFDLPASTGRAVGKVVWGSSLPVRYDIRVRGDSVALNDIAWVYPTLPRAGGGSMELRIRNERENLRVIDYALTKLDVRTSGSRITGAMTFAVGGPVLAVKDVALDGSPVDFKLLHTLNGKPLPVDWQGQIYGVVRGPGGPVNRFRVQDVRGVFQDAHVPGATSRFAARGELDILFPAFTVFRGFDVESPRIDLRSIQYLYPNFPRLGGYLAGRATLDSSWLDVRFTNGDVTHVDGAGVPSHVTGNGRVTYGEQFMTYDVNLAAEPLSFTTLARSYPMLPVRGTMTGPLRVKGTMESLDVVTTLTGAAGGMSVDGHFDLFPPLYAARFRGTATNVDLRTLLDRPDAPVTRLSARMEADVAGDSLADLIGGVDVNADRGTVDGFRLYPSHARLRFADGVLRVDTSFIETSAATLVARGGIGLRAGRSDTLHYVVSVDSLGGLRRFLGLPAPAAPQQVASTERGGVEAMTGSVEDSLAGSMLARGTASGRIDSVDVAGVMSGRGLFVGGSSARQLGGTYAITDLNGQPKGDLSLRLDTLKIAGVSLAYLAADAKVLDATRARVRAQVVSMNDVRAAATGALRFAGDTAELVMDSASVGIGRGEWGLVAPARLIADSVGLALDSLVLRNWAQGRLAVRGTLPYEQAVDVRITGDSVPLADLGMLLQQRDTLQGVAALDWRITGPRNDPTMTAEATLRGLRYGGARLELIQMRGGYTDRRIVADVGVFRRGRRALVATASLPVDLSLVSVRDRLLPDSLRGTITADSVELSFLEALTSNVVQASGRLDTQVALGGTWTNPLLSGRIVVANGAMGLTKLGTRLERINADVGFLGDSIVVRRLSAESDDPQRADTASLTGSISFRQGIDDPHFDLHFVSRDFHAIRQPRLADLWVSSDLDLNGFRSGSVLKGVVSVERGNIYVPELVQKKVVDLSDPDLFKLGIVDTSQYAVARLLPQPGDTAFLNHLTTDVRISIGSQAWLRSVEENLNIQLGGQVAVRRSVMEGGRPSLALEGQLTANRGTYVLELGPLVQRKFTVDRGVIVFNGQPELNPALDIGAVYTVRQQNRQDVRIRVTIAGTLDNPHLTLSSDENLPIQGADLISYLVTGAPSFAIGSGENAQTIANILLPGVTNLAAQRLLGNVVDVVEVRAADIDPTVISAQSSSSERLQGLGATFARSRISAGRQVGERTFVSADVGLCQFNPQSTTDVNFADALGVKVEHRFNHGISAQVGTEPGTAEVLCKQGTSVRGFAPTPRQLSFDLFKTWRF